ncbi:phosphoribosyltransferase [Phytoactinopolyspora mesophila]|uniref:Phosphoribosyltransferase n=1 Tax=Phytoactinopolyspora mesophila TaxID=2650750 RepID=A0A7K3MD90_9ACTN|nr:phosphoribosyltransferase family protein [Phytoactinopolyspora mesophila]NDL61017.1 phosphoribosyltransferase [Phytoactinopolyspora mesophila]
MTGIKMGPWRDREQAGRELGRALLERLGGSPMQPPLVLGLPRGGVVVAAAVTEVIGGELDVLVVRKVGVPWHRELAIGAVTASGLRIHNTDVIRRSRLRDQDAEVAFANAQREAQDRERLFRAGRPSLEFGGRMIVVVDDGLATGATALAAVELLENARPAPERVILAAPVAPPDTAARLASHVDDMVVLRLPADFMAVGEWFDDFTQVDDATVKRLLDGSATI